MGIDTPLRNLIQMPQAVSFFILADGPCLGFPVIQVDLDLISGGQASSRLLLLRLIML